MKSIWSHNSYRDILQTVFAERNLKNPSYSLRAFSRDIRLWPSHLSEILSGSRGLSRETAKSVAVQMGFASEEADFFSDLVESEHARTEIRRKVASQRLEFARLKRNFHDMRLDCFTAIENWYHFAILEIATCRGFRSDSNWIANKLRISPENASDAIERLIRLGLLKQTSKGWVNTDDHSKVGYDVPSSAIRKFHRQLLQRAVIALETQALEKREYNSLTMAISAERIGEAKELIRRFCRDFSTTVTTDKRKTDVYCLSVQFFNLIDVTEGP